MPAEWHHQAQNQTTKNTTKSTPLHKTIEFTTKHLKHSGQLALNITNLL